MTRQSDDPHGWTASRTPEPGTGSRTAVRPVTAVTRTGPDQVSVLSGGVTVAQADVDAGPQVVLRFWAATHALTPETRAELVRTAFAHASLVPRQRVLATVPHEETGLVAELHRHVTVTGMRVAGATCLVEGLVS